MEQIKSELQEECERNVEKKVMANAPTNTKVELTIKMIDLTVTMIHPPVAAHLNNQS